MELNKVVADLDFVKAIVHNVEANCRMTSISNDTKKEFGMDIKCNTPYIVDKRKIGKLLLQIDISVKQDDNDLEADTFAFVVEGVFSSDASIEDDRFLELLNINGGAALYSIARAKIEAMSSLIYSEGKLLLPMINIIQYYQERFATESED
ncbi:MAG: hypothetical protein IJ346_01875 [Clostridia bacterium]|nr:hypothetical protein [Clostridia bacterium]